MALLLGLATQVGSAATITSGVFDFVPRFPGPRGTFTLASDQFSVVGTYGTTSGSCSPCQPGTVSNAISFGDTSDNLSVDSGTVRGVFYPNLSATLGIASPNPGSSFAFSTGPFTIIGVGDYTVPFTFSGLLSLYDRNVPVSPVQPGYCLVCDNPGQFDQRPLSITGQGTATVSIGVDFAPSNTLRTTRVVYTFADATAVPEPGTWGLLAVSGAALAWLRRLRSRS